MSTKTRYIIAQIIMSASVSAFMPVFYVFLANTGFSNDLIGWYYAIFWLVSTFCEVPFGIYTDRYGTKRTMLLAVLVKLVGFSLLLLSWKNAVIIVLLGILTGIGEAGMSGCLPSWFVNVNNEEEEKNDVKEVFSKANIACSITGIIIGFVSGQVLYIKNVYYPIYLSIALFILAAAFFMSFKDAEKKECEETVCHLSWRDIINTFVETKGLILTFIGLSFVDVINCAPGNQWSKAFENANLFGYIWVAFNIVTIISNYLVGKFKRMKLNKYINDVLLVSETGLLVLILLNKAHLNISIILFVFYVFVYQIHTILYGAFIHTDVIKDDSKRNMQVSSFNMINSLMNTAGLVLVGYLTESIDMFMVWVIMSILACLGYVITRKKIWGRYE
ncbi:MAG: MFS transporter [Lachnospiraceae bacterium]|nr:MFS transporter [Lachnospiraceae bacterium]